MRDSDFDAFSELLDGVCGLLSRGKYTPNAQNTALFFRALSRHPLEVVRRGFEAHVADTKRGQFVPNPADILAQIEGDEANDGRPGADEAWSMVVRAADEAETVVWSEEMAQAWAIASPVLQQGDKVGARMAFKDAYARLVDEARKAQRPIAWTVSLGHDADRRHTALAAAEAAGLLPQGQALLLAPPKAPAGQLDQLLLANNANRPDAETVRQRVAALKAKMLRPTEEGPSPDEIARERTERLKREAAEKVAQYQSPDQPAPARAFSEEQAA